VLGYSPSADHHHTGEKFMKSPNENLTPVNKITPRVNPADARSATNIANISGNIQNNKQHKIGHKMKKIVIQAIKALVGLFRPAGKTTTNKPTTKNGQSCNILHDDQIHWCHDARHGSPMPREHFGIGFTESGKPFSVFQCGRCGSFVAAVIKNGNPEASWILFRGYNYRPRPEHRPPSATPGKILTPHRNPKPDWSPGASAISATGQRAASRQRGSLRFARASAMAVLGICLSFICVATPVGAAPATPTSPNPGTTTSPGPTTVSSTVTLSWGASSGATYYDLGVRDIATGNLVVNTTTTATSYTVALTAGKQYKWNVAAGNATGESAFTTVLYFQTPAAVVIPPTPTSPSPGTTSSPGPTMASSTVTFSWVGSSGATYYDLGVRDIATGNLVVNTTTTATSYTATLPAADQLKWNVAAGNSAGESAFTAVQYFQTPAAIPATPTSPTPGTTTSPGPTMASNVVTLSWTASPGATYYDLGVRDIATGNLVVNTTTTATSYTATLPAADQLKWNVAAGNSAGESAFTTVQYFQTPVGASQKASMTLSRVTSTPTAPADGMSALTVTVTLLDNSGNPVPGKSVNIYAGTAPVTIMQPAFLTDINGKTTGTLTTTTPCNGWVWAIDRTDGNLLLQQEAPIQFTQQPLVAVGSTLNTAINSLSSSSINTLNGISTIALDEGAIGDGFRAQMSSDEANSCANIGFFALGALIPDPAGLGAKIASKLGINMAGLMTGDVLSAIFSNPNGLSNGGSVTATACSNNVQSLQGQVAALQGGVPSGANNNATAYSNEIANRLSANAVLYTVLQRQDTYLKILEGAAQSAQNGLVPETLKIASYIGGGLDVASVIPALTPVALPSALIFNSALAAANSLQLWQSYDANQNAYFKTFSSLSACWDVAGAVNLNATSAFSEIAQGLTPNAPTGSIVSANTSETYYQVGQLPASWQIAGSTPASTVGFITNCYSQVTVQNTGTNSAQFVVFASFDYQNGVFGLTTNMPLVAWTATNLLAGQSAQVQLNYYDGNSGAPPAAGSVIPISVLAVAQSGTFYVGSFNSVVTPQVTGTGLLGAVSHSQILKNSGTTAGATPNGASASNNMVVVENPIKCLVVYNRSNYTATLFVANPFDSTLNAVVNQPLPAGINVINASGVIQSGNVTWTNSITPGGVAVDTFSFMVSANSGTSTNLPTPGLMFVEPNSTNSLVAQPVAPNFQSAIPVQVTASVPAGVAGTDTPMFVTLTNTSASNATGTLTICLADNNGQVTNFSQTVVMQGLGCTSLTFVLPGSLGSGSYSLTGTVTVNGGTSQVLAGAFVVTPPALTLGFASPTPWLTNGLNLVLHGSQTGSNYLIWAASDLSSSTNWQPFLYFTATNATIQFADPSAANYPQRFYRAVGQ
jgi:hypothetical protein